MLNESAFDRANAEARKIQDQSGFPPALDDSRLEATDILFWVPIEGDGPLDALIKMQHANDHCTRAVVGATLHALLAEYPTGEAHDTLRDALRRLVESVPVAGLSDLALLRWEIHLAAAARSLERLLEIARRLEEIGAPVELRAQVVNAAFLQVHPSSIDLDILTTPSALDPLIYAPGLDLHFVSDALIYMLATTVERRGELQWREPATFPAPMLDALIDIEALLHRLQNATKSLTPTQCAIRSWCWFAGGAATCDAGKLNQAGQSYESLPAHPLGLAKLNGLPPATSCFALAGQWRAALEAARKWIAEAPDDAAAHGRLAEAHYKLSEIPEAVRAYEDYVRLHRGSENDWKSSLLLQLGLEVHERRANAIAIETAAFSANIRPQGERLIAWFFPWFDSLSPQARGRWWVGMFTLSSPHNATEMDPERWDIAADSFGEAVAFELKARIFGPFAASAQHTPPDDFWKRALGRRGTLGEMIGCLLHIKTSNHTTVQQLSKWLRTNHPRLFAHIHDPRARARLSRMVELRKNAQHDSVTEGETREVFDEAADLLGAIVSK